MCHHQPVVFRSVLKISCLGMLLHLKLMHILGIRKQYQNMLNLTTHPINMELQVKVNPLHIQIIMKVPVFLILMNPLSLYKLLLASMSPYAKGKYNHMNNIRSYPMSPKGLLTHCWPMMDHTSMKSPNLNPWSTTIHRSQCHTATLSQSQSLKLNPLSTPNPSTSNPVTLPSNQQYTPMTTQWRVQTMFFWVRTIQEAGIAI